MAKKQILSEEMQEFRDNAFRLKGDDLMQLLNIIDSDKDAEKYEILREAWFALEHPPIVRAPMEIRIWTHFYERYLLRLGMIVWAVIAMVLLKGYFQGDLSSAQRPALAAGALLLWALWHVWMAFLESSPSRGGSSFLRRSMNIRVVTKDGKPLSFWKSFLRSFFKGFPINLFVTVTMEHSSQERGIHDKIFGTYVVRVRDESISENDIARFIRENYR